MRQWIWLALVQIRVWRLFGAKPFLNQCWVFNNGPLGTNFSDIWIEIGSSVFVLFCLACTVCLPGWFDAYWLAFDCHLPRLVGQWPAKAAIRSQSTNICRDIGCANTIFPMIYAHGFVMRFFLYTFFCITFFASVGWDSNLNIYIYMCVCVCVWFQAHHT